MKQRASARHPVVGSFTDWFVWAAAGFALACNLPGAPTGLAQSAGAEDAARGVIVGNEDGTTYVARRHGPPEARLLFRPDGYLVRAKNLVFTDTPFRPATAADVRDTLLAGPFKGFKVIEKGRYVVLYQCSDSFANSSANLLDSLYNGLLEKLAKLGFDVHEAEFPLVAIIYANEEDFRANREIDPDIQAYYEIFSNRIYFYEVAQTQREDPMFEAMRKPQTVAHEGTHQVLHNIGIQARLAEWPPWLVEGLAELAAATTTGRNGKWAGFSLPNPLHIATFDDLADTQAQHDENGRPVRSGPDWGSSMTQYIIAADRLNPTDYALAWVMTHYLANKKTDKFIAFLKELGERPPGYRRSAEEDREVFRRHFGKDAKPIDIRLKDYIGTLRSKAQLTYYAVTFEQALPNNFVRRGTLVSRSPQVIRQWIEQKMPDPNGGAYQWRAVPCQNRNQAVQFTDQWLQANL